MKLEILQPAKGSVRNNTRLGRGQGSGGGGTAKRGHKGAKSRSGYSSKRGFEGGQMPLQRRLPKFGFNNINRIEYKAINLDALQALAEKASVSTIDLGFLRENGLISKFDLVKVLGRGELKSKLSVSANAFSKSAIDAITKLGGSATVVSGKKSAPVVVEEPVAVKKVKVPSVSNDAAKTESVEEAAVVEEAVAAVVSDAIIEAPVAKAKSSKSKGDDLKIIEGIGPKIADLLIADGIDTFVKLSESSEETLSAILEKAGSNFATHNPATWPEQAGLAAAGKMDELKELQDKLNGGRPE